MPKSNRQASPSQVAANKIKAHRLAARRRADPEFDRRCKQSWIESRERGHARRLVQEAGLPLWRFLVDRARELLDDRIPRDVAINDLTIVYSRRRAA